MGFDVYTNLYKFVNIHQFVFIFICLENAHLQRILQSIRNERLPGSGRCSRIGSDTSLKQRRKQEMISMRRAAHPTKTRGEYQMHPEWPPSIPHHWFP